MIEEIWAVEVPESWNGNPGELLDAISTGNPVHPTEFLGDRVTGDERNREVEEGTEYRVQVSGQLPYLDLPPNGLRRCAGCGDVIRPNQPVAPVVGGSDAATGLVVCASCAPKFGHIVWNDEPDGLEPPG
ncbi:hypothetical protein ACQPW1_10305 [Nocardia sp. CA-128927]|uniref:hypothetical protein n=1 Tax=Nocardia sp. CA-128927 TaxID=3239975 RepID=UPI003D96D8D0